VKFCSIKKLEVRKKVISGQWAVGSWQLAVGSWQLAIGNWQLFNFGFKLNYLSSS
jgi:hypothetical protein